ncbi:ribonuclease P protein component [Aestuariivivens sediminis]|uniref:ribonuclease P protein component n=1 Tax=Aestuariivivens sediminis TaxID=2913557 RepID=UPI0030B7F6B8
MTFIIRYPMTHDADGLLYSRGYHQILISIFVVLTQLMAYTFPKKEKLKSKTLIEQLFLEGKSVSAFPLRLVYLETPLKMDVQMQIGVSVSKRHFKKAVDRNRIKRLIREVYRLHKTDYFNNITTQCALMILYIGKDKPTYSLIETKMKQLMANFLKNYSEHKRVP